MQRVLRTVILLSLAVVAGLAGCSSSTEGIRVTGELLLNGLPQTGELVFEPIGQTAARSVTVYADEAGQFEAFVACPVAAQPIELRLVVRPTAVNSAGLPTAFDRQAPPEKVVELKRSLSDGQHVVLLLTQ